MKLKNIKTIIQKYFFLNPTAKLRVREIERTLKLSLPSVIRYCKELEKEGIIKIARTGNVIFYTADRTNLKYLLEKRSYNIKQIHCSGIIDYLKEALSNPVIVVFGSYAKGEDTETSDLDLYIETPSKKNVNLEKFEKFLRRKIQIFLYNDINKISNKHLANNIINGITLNNFLEVFK
ncbi:MAG TPA: nucleotidyltransferase domain-containing protein [Candidatus Nanoarchaeia archaeon]|nr:nucleotidyltransferase domain-containing protein [Candidatus Nanoarchaeia archaeon]